jgi:hypothetical protein
MDLEIREEIDSMTEHYREVMPAPIKELITQLNHDLYSGPTYYGPDGEECSYFDEGAEPFQFSYSLGCVRDWIEGTVEDVQMEVSYDPEGGASYCERVDGSAREITRKLLGKGLAAML